MSDGQVPLPSNDDGEKYGAAEADVVDRVGELGHQVHPDITVMRPRPEKF